MGDTTIIERTEITWQADAWSGDWPRFWQPISRVIPGSWGLTRLALRARSANIVPSLMSWLRNTVVE
jgi:hypothetical protein